MNPGKHEQFDRRGREQGARRSPPARSTSLTHLNYNNNQNETKNHLHEILYKT